MSQRTEKVYRVAVGSTNPIKLQASEKGVKEALQAALPEEEKDTVEIIIHSQCFASPSGVSDQPSTDAETKTGAINRSKAAWEAYIIANEGNEPHFSVGLEGGVVDDGESMCCDAWMAVYNGVSLGTARTCSFTLPPEIRSLVLGGMELGPADDRVFGLKNSKQSCGSVGILTRGVIDRAAYYAPAIVLAMVPLLWPDLYPPA